MIYAAGIGQLANVAACSITRVVIGSRGSSSTPRLESVRRTAARTAASPCWRCDWFQSTFKCFLRVCPNTSIRVAEGGGQTQHSRLLPLLIGR